MNNERYNQIINEVYIKYLDYLNEHQIYGVWYDDTKSFERECKADKDFAEIWGLQIEERELSLEERSNIWNETHNPAGNIYTHNQYNENEIPSIVITVTYKDEKIEVYE